jgi:phosphoglycerol transferase
VITSDDIIRCQPDCVLVTHEVSPKLTPFPTLGLMWSPPAFYAEDPVRRRSILSLDGHLCGSRKSRNGSTTSRPVMASVRLSTMV